MTRGLISSPGIALMSWRPGRWCGRIRVMLGGR
jgi:hypothetical protein